MEKRNGLFCFLFLMSIYSQGQNDIEGHIRIDNISRDYLIHLPKNYSFDQPIPLVLIFHGGGGNSRQMQRYMGMDAIADKENFITLYPQGLNKQWNDGRDFKEAIAFNNDVKFISQLLDTLERKFAIDARRVFATGISNGAFLSIYLAYKLSERFLAVAPVCGSIPLRIFDMFYPTQPVSLLLINGTGDPLVPYYGGSVGNKLIGNRGECVSTDKTIERFIAVDKTLTKPRVENLPDNDKTDGCNAIQYTYANGTSNSKVELVKIINGGHTLPGGIQYLPKFIIGRVCSDFNANEMIWNFFKNCSPRS